uniref:Uncharacterized protein n=1 Tax=Opuntia streptacantha TaxID=393608 RepID=A0A7C8YZQ6_OPUST
MILIAPAFLFLLNRGNNPPRSPPCTNHILVSNRQKVPLLYGKFLSVCHLCNFLHELHHFFIPLRLLGQLGHVNIFFPCRIGRHFDFTKQRSKIGCHGRGRER